MEPVHSGQSLLEMLAQMPDPRSKYGRRYPLTSLITAIILAALNGQSSLRGIWLWVKAHSDLITMHLPFHRNRIPALETFRTLLCRLDASLLLEIFNRWLKAVNSEPISIDERVLRGSKRDDEVPLWWWPPFVIGWGSFWSKWWPRTRIRSKQPFIFWNGCP